MSTVFQRSARSDSPTFSREASDRGYRVLILGDCCESVSDEWQDFSMTQILPLIAQVVTVADFGKALSRPPTAGTSGPRR
jgi:hypothetical protein